MLKRVTPRLDRELLDIKSKSSLEDPVIDFVANAVCSFQQRARVIKGPRGRAWEIDIYIPELSLGFEVQDFKTHHRTRDTVPLGLKSNDSRFKNGPTYHELKRRLAKEQLGVTIIDIWEDSIMDGSFKALVEKAIAEAQQNLRRS